ncbi:MAG: DNA helicase RecG [Deltaproteobacteria bacterium]|nr:MAG: DNA helicase RecG [Deltaproteobacteria bacterium]
MTITGLDRYRQMVSVMDTPLTALKGVGPKVFARFEKKGLRTIGDALAFLPYRYEDRTTIKNLNELLPGEATTFMGKLKRLEVRGYRKRRVLEGLLVDERGALSLKWFRGNFDWLLKKYPVGEELIGYGTVGVFAGRKEVVHPELELVGEDYSASESDPVTPVYSEVEGVHQRQLRRIMRQAVESGARARVPLVPQEAQALSGLDPRWWEDPGRIWRELHFPSKGGEDLTKIVAGCRHVAVLEEFFLLQIALLLKKSGDEAVGGVKHSPTYKLVKALLSSLSYELTDAQRRVLGEIRADMERPSPMHRLLQGDVGSGKTLVALNSALLAIEGGYQAALMAPTEVLAEQHFKNISQLLTGLPVNVRLLTGSTTAVERESLLGELSTGAIDLIIGTHALIVEDVSFRRLGLIVVDEQHRFGVMQRVALAEKGRDGALPDTLVMTATPIPRSLSMTVYGDLDLSVIDEMPPGRRPVSTKIVKERGRGEVFQFVRQEVSKGRQAYVVCPLVEESEKVELKAAVETANHFSSEIFPDLSVGLLHGRMRGSDKAEALEAFSSGKTQVLVSTTVIEVGIDVPNATVMLVEHAERFGLSQLHQLRGRVGRGGNESWCFLLAGGSVSEDGWQRLRVMEETNDGFRISEEDLRIRGPGDMLGTRQSGLPDFQIGNILRDGPLLEVARGMAQAVLKADPPLSSPDHSVVKRVVEARWSSKLSLLYSG